VTVSAARVEAVVFDLYGTLLDLSGVEDAAAGIVPDPADLSARWRRAQLERTWLLTLMGGHEDFLAVTGAALDAVVGERGLELPPDAREELIAAWTRLDAHPDVPAALERLASRRLAVLTNATPAMAGASLGHAGLRDRVDPVLSVEAVGAFKPAPVVYGHAAGALGLPPGRLLMVSANPWDAAGAAAAGMAVAAVRRAPGAAPGGVVAADALLVSDLGELADALG
jgi:2-haloacid dehalogenase